MIFINADFRLFHFDIWLGNVIVESFGSQTIPSMAYANFMSIAEDIAQKKEPMKVVCTSTADVQPNNLNDASVEKPVKMIFYNQTYEKEIGINE